MTMRDAALALARQGFSVFPVKKGDNRPPLILGWQIAATVNEDQIRQWWAKWPDANIGVHCKGLLVIDVDPKKGGYASLAKLELEVDLPQTYEVETPSGGRHIYFRVSNPVANGVDVLGSGLDIRAENGYVVGSGSRRADGDYHLRNAYQIADAPEKLHALTSQAKQKNSTGKDTGPETDHAAAIGRGRDFLRSHPVAIEGQGGDAHTYATICRLRDFGISDTEANAVLSDWNSRCNPPWNESDLAVKIANAYAYAQDPAGKLTPEALGFELAAEEGSGTQTGSVGTTPAPFSLDHPSDVELNDVLRSEYLIKGVLERQSNAVLFGQWNVGKSFVVLDMAACISSGQPWFGRRVRQGRVLYLGYEGLRALKKRMVALRGKYPALKDRITPFGWTPMRLPLTRPEGVAALGAILTAFAAEHGGPPDLIILDPLSNALGGDDADATLMGALNECVAALIQKQLCTVLRVHHSGHGNQDRARGHSSLPAGVDTEIRVTEQEIVLTKQRDDVRAKMLFRLDVVTLGVDSDGDDVTTCIVTEVAENSMAPELTTPQRAVLDLLIANHESGSIVTKTEIKDASRAVGLTPVQGREIITILLQKLYLVSAAGGYKIAERGALAVFD